MGPSWGRMCVCRPGAPRSLALSCARALLHCSPGQHLNSAGLRHPDLCSGAPLQDGAHPQAWTLVGLQTWDGQRGGRHGGRDSAVPGGSHCSCTGSTRASRSKTSLQLPGGAAGTPQPGLRTNTAPQDLPPPQGAPPVEEATTKSSRRRPWGPERETEWATPTP